MRGRVASLSQTFRHCAPIPPNRLRHFTPLATSPIFTLPRCQRATFASRASPLEEEKQDEWIVAQERTKILALAQRIRIKSKHLKTLKVFVQEQLLDTDKLNESDRRKAKELLSRLESEEVHTKTLFVQFADLLNMTAEELHAETDPDGPIIE
ncbi:hypothetical protein NA57DRAFT_72518 [Rhizodiscina lignyota]|uniref:Uncharacterized protein n=1 Tax=Rhizodiscina lignyota TaxID=1504668 RepID=A0A9P4MDK5_9PEZI|nr:hypothetical protein NA57DRAFT_72518 [Rhizodiscina lignyota]